MVKKLLKYNYPLKRFIGPLPKSLSYRYNYKKVEENSYKSNVGTTGRKIDKIVKNPFGSGFFGLRRK